MACQYTRREFPCQHCRGYSMKRHHAHEGVIPRAFRPEGPRAHRHVLGDARTELQHFRECPYAGTAARLLSCFTVTGSRNFIMARKRAPTSSINCSCSLARLPSNHSRPVLFSSIQLRA